MIRPESLLAPVPGDLPQGIDLRNPTRQPPLYDAFTALRNARQRDERADGELLADWGAVEKLTAAILIAHSKDLEVAGWLAEALVHTDGFAGLAVAGEVIAGLAERFWGNLFPAPDPEDPAGGEDNARLEPLLRLVEEKGRLLPAIGLVALFTLGDGTVFNYLACQRLKNWSELSPAERANRPSPAGGTRLWETVRTAASGQHAFELGETRRTIAAAREAWCSVAAAVAARVGEDRFSCQPLVDLLDAVLRITAELAPAAPAVAPRDEALSPGATAAVPTSHVGSFAHTFTTREEAIRQLTLITAFFRRTEPFSPVANTLEEAIRRARLDWLDWLAEAVPDQAQRETILTRLGLRPDPTKG